MFSLFNRNNIKTEVETQPQDLSDEQVESLRAIAGGRDEYQAMVRWAKNMKSEQYVVDFDEILVRADYDKITVAVTSLKKQYDTAMDADPEGTAEASKEAMPEPPALCKQVWELMVGEGNYENNSLTDMQEVTKMCLYLIEREHQEFIDHIQGNSEHDETRAQFETDIAKIRAAKHIISNIW